MAKRRIKEGIEQQIVGGLLLAFGRGLIAIFRLLGGHAPDGKVEARRLVQAGWPAVLAEPDGRHRVIEADKLLDEALKFLVSGKDLGSRLKAAKRKFNDYSSYQAAWRGHKVRNQLVHEIDHRLSENQARLAINDFRTAFLGLGLL